MHYPIPWAMIARCRLPINLQGFHQQAVQEFLRYQEMDVVGEVGGAQQGLMLLC